MVEFWVELAIMVAIVWWLAGPKSFFSRLLNKEYAYIKQKQKETHKQRFALHQKRMSKIALKAVDDIIIELKKPVDYYNLKSSTEEALGVTYDVLPGNVVVSYNWLGEVIDSREYPLDQFTFIK